MPANALKYLQARVPRYTSYPTAVQFGRQVDAATYAAWLAELPPAAPVSLYLHVPFCPELCLYCGCNTAAVRRYGPVEAYVELLEREIDAVGAIAGARAIAHLHWGGGTPTMLSLPDFAKLMDLLRRKFSFAAGAEIAIEIDPRRMTRHHAAALTEQGITRASLGVQDFDERVQRAVSRVQTFAQTSRVVEWFREAGTAGINLDLMYGLPYQTAATLTKTIAQAAELGADRIALFGYAHVPWMKRHQRLIAEAALPGSEQRFAQSQAAGEQLAGAGYVPIGLDHFAKRDDLLARRHREGRLHRNFQGYTTDEAEILIGFGASAIGSLPQGYVQNFASGAAYRAAIGTGLLATSRGIALTAEDRLRRDVISHLMCDLRVDLAEICATHGVTIDHFAAGLARLDEFAAEGLLERTGAQIRLPEHSRPFVRVVCAVFDQYLASSETRYSRAS
jgi:oxygen-independent coproporphyrinogen-3 oxidase